MKKWRNAPIIFMIIILKIIKILYQGLISRNPDNSPYFSIQYG